MRGQVELSATIQRAMKEKGLEPKELCKKLGVSEVMLKKIMCGDVVPSRHLQKQMTEVLGIEVEKVKRVTARRQKKATSAMKSESRTRKAS